ncbi:MAG: L-threonylcarbamoyladenylate synthase [Rhodospirillaceae bacterium]|nr:L-threonylcarbamoyladenylate synthase [Rhodospirillaceae bacterium]
MPILIPTPSALAEAAERLRAGELVAFPTETVYGLGGDATSDKAVAAIFEAKRRPSFNPLIATVADIEAAERLVEMDARARRLAELFWPGPLTLVLPRRKDSGLSLLVTAGLDSVAVRVPEHPVTLDLLRAARIPIAGPSANPSGTVSPTTAAHVEAGLGDRVSMILDGGPCRVGVESTVLALLTPVPIILRPGGVSRERIEAELGPVSLVLEAGKEGPRSPGMTSHHYAPSLPVRIEADRPRPGEAWLAFGTSPVAADLNLSPSGNVTEAAANLFAMLRALDRPPFTGIAVMPIPRDGLGLAINDRLKRAAAPRAA